ncbi:hypothetical protein C7212DRAFT_363338 [Tuber magnatum]|uniref:BTB domain-containing protein n=1 Tax=Tuber magnatum TaxID=42249 RepID=A0A317SU95_9PEZI|nr:hypothetical protein C7212DRAFT_363338 [Tuber magnatum]
MGRPDIASRFKGKMMQIDTVDGAALHAHVDVLDSGRGVRTDTPWNCFKTSTVERFLEYCYQGDYSVPKPAKPLLATPTSSVYDRDNKEDEDNKEDDDDRASDIADSDTEDDTGPSGHPNGLDYRAVFFTHAELYVLSQTQRRSSLTALCLNRLRGALDMAAKAPVRPRFASNLSDLLLYVYEHSNVGLIDDQQAHDLQNLVSSCAAMHIKEMREECSLLMRCGGKMAEDLMKEVVCRVVGLEIMLKKEKEKKERERRERKEKEAKERREKEEEEKERREKEEKEKEENERKEQEKIERREREEIERREREERERMEREERERMEREERERKEKEEKEKGEKKA